MAERLLKIEKSHLLLVEGNDEKNFFEPLLRLLGLTTLQIIPVGGKVKFAATFRALILLPKFDEVISIGIVRDADDDRLAAFDSICSSLKSAKLPIPTAERLPMTDNERQITILIMPPNSEGTGRMLEDLCLESMVDNPAMNCVQDYFDCLAAAGISFADNQVAKARIHAFLASRESPDKRLGEAAQAGYWDWSSPVFEPVKEFLQLVANP